MKKIVFGILLFYPCVIIAQIKVDDYIKKWDEAGITSGIQQALNVIDTIGHGSIEFSGTKTYTINESLLLPTKKKAGRKIIVLNGNGAIIKTKVEISIFKRIPKSQDQALNEYISSRFVIRDFQFEGGSKAIDIGATYGTVIENSNFIGQGEAAIDIQFGLNTEITQCIITNPKKNGIVIRCGEDWGGSTVNSQSNHTVVTQCRVYAAKGMETCFKILGSSGVVLRDIISEGSGECDYSVYFDRLNSTTVRLFTISNFHLEHAPKKAAIYLNHTGTATIDGLYYQLAFDGFKLVQAAPNAEQITLRNIPHFVSGTVVYSGNNEVPWRVEYCHKSFYDPKTWRIKKKEEEVAAFPFYFSGHGGKYQIKKQY